MKTERLFILPLLITLLALLLGCMPTVEEKADEQKPAALTPVPTVVILGAAGEYQVIVDLANLRKLPNLGSETAVVLHKNDIIKVDGRTDDSQWFHTDVSGGAWILAEFLKEYKPQVDVVEVEDISTEPVVIPTQEPAAKVQETSVPTPVSDNGSVQTVATVPLPHSTNTLVPVSTQPAIETPIPTEPITFPTETPSSTPELVVMPSAEPVEEPIDTPEPVVTATVQANPTPMGTRFPVITLEPIVIPNPVIVPTLFIFPTP